MEVALDATALGVACLDDAGPGGAHLLELGAYLRGQPLVLDRETGDGGHRPDPSGILLVDGRVVGQHREGLAVALETREAAIPFPPIRNLDRLAVGIDEP